MRRALVLALLLTACRAPTTVGHVVWAWERPEDLRSLPATVEVAFLARTIRLHGDRIEVRPRLQPLSVTPGAPLTAVIRVEPDPREPPSLSESQRHALAAAIEAAAGGTGGVQLDFDARPSERAFYRALLGEVRERLPRSTRLTMTALASWCFYDDWLAGLPVDEAVPMLYRLGAERARVRFALEDGREFRAPLCRSSVGLSTDEPLARRWLGRRVYHFNPRAWTPASLRAALELP